jgi:hypothetical protein
MRQNEISLQQLKANILTEEEKRKALVDKGAAAFRLGIERRDCPLKLDSERRLWENGYDNARKAFDITWRTVGRS